MQRGISITGLWMGIAVLAVAFAASCGTGIRDGQGDWYVSKTIDQSGGQLVLGEATLDIKDHSLKSPPALITLRRFPAVQHSGAVGAVFEIQIPIPDTFSNDPRIAISTSDAVATATGSMIGYLVPGADNEQWIPDSSQAVPPCSGPVVCGPVQSQEFTNRGGAADSGLTTTRLQFAIVTQCDSAAICPIGQTCSSRACQQCAAGGPCNYPPP
jgi:hypothetical protein